MTETDRSTETIVDHETVRHSIALSYVKAWQNLPPGPGDLLGTVLPVLAAGEPREFPSIRLRAETFGDNYTDAHRMAWKALTNAAGGVHRSKVRHRWYRWNEEKGREVRCHADLVWTTEVRFDPVVREVELVFWPRLIEYLPAILEPLKSFATQRPPAKVTPTVNGGLTGYFHHLQP